MVPKYFSPLKRNTRFSSTWPCCSTMDHSYKNLRNEREAMRPRGLPLFPYSLQQAPQVQTLSPNGQLAVHVPHAARALAAQPSALVGLDKESYYIKLWPQPQAASSSTALMSGTRASAAQRPITTPYSTSCTFATGGQGEEVGGGGGHDMARERLRAGYSAMREVTQSQN